MRSDWMGSRSSLLLALFLLAGAANALAIGPRIYEQDDLGDISLSEFTYSLSADCNASTISVFVYNETNRPIRDANLYLKYVDFSTPLMSNTKTDKDGFSLVRLPGNVLLMRGLFVLIIEKTGYRNKEVHFDLSPCWGGSSIPTKPQTNGTANSSNATSPTTPLNPPSNNSTATVPPTNPSANGTGAGNQTQNGTGIPEETQPCQGAAFLLASAFAVGWFIKRGRE